MINLLLLLTFSEAQVLYRNVTEQAVELEIYSFGLNHVNHTLALVRVRVEATAVPCLLVVGKERPPSVSMSENGDLLGNYDAADLTSFALGRSEAFIQLSLLDLHPNSTLHLGVFLPKLPLPSASVVLEVWSHGKAYSDGDLCPMNCMQHGTCTSGVCSCEQPWVDQSCSIMVSYVELGQNYDLIIPPNTYRFFSTSYGPNSLIHLELTRLQGDSQLFMSYGGNRVPPTLRRNDVVRAVDTRNSSVDLYIDPSEIGDYGLICSVKTTNPNYQSVISLTFQQINISSSSNLYVILGIVIGLGCLCLCCCLICVRFLYRQRRIRREGARVQIYHNWSQSLEQEKVLFEASKVNLDSKTPQDCVICLDGLSVDQAVSELPCSHLFHTACINAWFEKHNFCCVCKHIYEVHRN